MACESAGDTARAIALHEQTRATRMRLLGQDHPDTLNVLNNLASAYQAAGDSRGVPLYRQTLADCVRVLGNDHPITQQVRRNLGNR